jgi:hypothetical protein
MTLKSHPLPAPAGLRSNQVARIETVVDPRGSEEVLMDPVVQRQAQGDRILRYFLETGYIVRDVDGEVRLVVGAQEPDLSVICDRRGHVVPSIQDYVSAIAHLPAPDADAQLPSAV